jgi:hypothetical protein
MHNIRCSLLWLNHKIIFLHKSNIIGVFSKLLYIIRAHPGRHDFPLSEVKEPPSYKATLNKDHPSYKATLNKDHPLIWTDFKCIEILKYY